MKRRIVEFEMMATSWQRRRSEWNHDWLKNQYLPALAKWCRILDEEVIDANFEHRFIRDVLPAWEERCSPAMSLLNSFENDMSPRANMASCWFGHFGSESLNWMGDVVHALWKSRHPVSSWTEEAISCLKQADEVYTSLQAEIATEHQHDCAAALRPFRARFEAFREACVALGRAIEEFPSRVLVV